MASSVPLKWGILGCGKISHDFLISFKALLNPKDHQVVACAARERKKAEEFAKIHGIPNVRDTYEALLADSEIDVIYIGTIHPQHLEWGKKCLDAGKHVLCEKPLCMNSRETKELLEYAKAKKLFIMEALWVRFFPAYQKLREIIQNGLIGEVRQVFVSFGAPLGEVERCTKKELGGGSTLDIGIYCVQLSQLAYQGQKPILIKSTGVLNPSGVDTSSSVTLTYEGGKIATFITNHALNLPNEGFIIGDKGYVKLHNPFWPCTKLEVFLSADGKSPLVYEFDLPKVDKTQLHFWNTEGLCYQCEEVRECIQNGKTESSIMTHSETIMISEILEQIRMQIGVKYDQD